MDTDDAIGEYPEMKQSIKMDVSAQLRRNELAGDWRSNIEHLHHNRASLLCHRPPHSSSTLAQRSLPWDSVCNAFPPSDWKLIGLSQELGSQIQVKSARQWPSRCETAIGMLTQPCE